MIANEDTCTHHPGQIEQRTAQIAALNDAMRRGRGSGKLAITNGVIALGSGAVAEALVAVSEFEVFNEDNDPHGEHDFGAFECRGSRLFWKIDYYDRQLTSGSLDPTDPSVTARVLTVMLAEEY